MAKLPPEVTETLWNLKRQALDIVEEAIATEYSLFDLAKKLADCQINGRKHLTISTIFNNFVAHVSTSSDCALK